MSDEKTEVTETTEAPLAIEKPRVALTAQAIRDAQDLPMAWVDLTDCGWGGGVWVRTLSGEQRDLFENKTLERSYGKKVNLKNMRARFAVAVCCEENGTPLFKSNDLSWLTTKSSKALDKIYDAGSRLAGMSSEDVEELVKNCESGQSDNSGLSSQDT
ncbi:MAG: hypothetical protein GY832_22010 [Chloroflexi bacterium]|nr:hypothetical protein [Chloroflexota bacterium]